MLNLHILSKSSGRSFNLEWMFPRLRITVESAPILRMACISVACAAFFRRTVALSLRYICRGSNECPIEKRARNMCRSCRYRRCLKVGMQSEGVQPARDTIGKRKELVSQSYQRPTSSRVTVEEAESSFQTELLDKMHQGYLHLLTIRKATHAMVEKGNCSLFGNAEALFPSNFDNCKKVCQLESHLVADIVNTYFDPFGELDNTQKTSLFKNFFCYLSHTDRTYQSYKIFGKNESNDKLLMPDGGFIQIDELEKFYSNAEGVHTDPKEAAKIYRPVMEYILQVIIVEMKRLSLTDIEYMAILGFFLWNKGQDIKDINVNQKIEATQQQILSDLHNYYRRTSLNGCEITVRIGQLMLLLPKLTRSVMMIRENSALAELFNIFDADICCKEFKLT